MSWLEVIKKNADKKVEEKKVEKVEEEKEDFDVRKLEEYRDFDEEFDLNYENELIDIKMTFLELLEEYGFPLMNSRDTYLNYNNSYKEFMKRNTFNGDKLKYECETFNEQLRQDYLDASEDDEAFNNLNPIDSKKPKKEIE